MSKALILIDYINDICHEKGNPASCAISVKDGGVIPKVNELAAYARANNWLVIWVVVAFDKNYLEASRNSPTKKINALQRDTWGTELLADLDYKDGELIVVKNAVNPFYATNLDHILRNQNIDEIYVAGVATEIAIQSCTRDASDRGYKVNVVADCCAGRNPEFHEVSLRMLASFANVINVLDLVAG